jgi:hypothetical protein
MKLIFSFLMVCLMLTTSAFASTQMREQEPFNTELSDVFVEKESIEFSILFEKESDVFIIGNQMKNESKNFVFTENLFNHFIEKPRIGLDDYNTFKNTDLNHPTFENFICKIPIPYSMASLCF